MKKLEKNIVKDETKKDIFYHKFFLEQVREKELVEKQKEEFILDKLTDKVKGKKIYIDKALTLSL